VPVAHGEVAARLLEALLPKRLLHQPRLLSVCTRADTFHRNISKKRERGKEREWAAQERKDTVAGTKWITIDTEQGRHDHGQVTVGWAGVIRGGGYYLQCPRQLSSRKLNPVGQAVTQSHKHRTGTVPYLVYLTIGEPPPMLSYALDDLGALF
jgi:hypothetical protein